MTKSSPQAVLSLQDVAGERFRVGDCGIERGQTARFMCSSQDERHWIWSTLTGVRAPEHGTVRVLGGALYKTGAHDMLALLGRVGWVPQDGGLISNLKAWENLILPVSYHKGRTAAQVEQDVVRIFSELEVSTDRLSGMMGRLPDRLSLLERRWIATARAMLMQPDIMVYDAPFSGVERADATRLLNAIMKFHGASSTHTSVFLLPNETFSDRVPSDVTITLEN
jgi:phospholipid/cholesterol/gamma-HCH transport system ATP-binding protein